MLPALVRNFQAECPEEDLRCSYRNAFDPQFGYEVNIDKVMIILDQKLGHRSFCVKVRFCRRVVDMHPLTLAHFAQGLEPGASYGFQVRAFNFNGAGDESDIAVFKPCTISSSLAIPQIL